MCEDKNGFLLTVTKGVLTALIVNVIGALIFAFVINVAMLPNSVIKPINQFIKVLAIFLGCFTALKGGLGLVKGLMVGAISSAITYAIFALCIGGVGFTYTFFLDILFGIIVGALSGVLTVNVKKD